VRDCTWRFENEWPLARTEYTRFYLSTDRAGAVRDAIHDVKLLTESPQAASALTYDAGPAADARGKRGLPSVSFSSEPLSANTEITGPINLVMWVSSDTDDMDLFAYLRKTLPDGTVQTASDNLRCLDQAVELGAPTVVIQLGRVRPGERDLDAARERAVDGLLELIPHAVNRRLQLAMEILHPMFCPDVSVLSSLRQALDLTDQIAHPALGLNVDTMHVWWDPELVPQLQRAGRRVFLVQLNDWLLPPPPRGDRGLPGEGCIDYGPFMSGLQDFAGWFEVEAASDALRAMPVRELFERSAASFTASIGPHLAAASSP